MSTTCYHCHNPVYKTSEVLGLIHGKEEAFCCTGCKTVAELIVYMGKDYFYDLRGSSQLKPVVDKVELSENLDSEFTYNEFVTGKDPQNKEVFVNITNIHCSACVWLNEKILSETKGIKKAHINFSTGRAHIIWDDTVLKLSTICGIITSIGYIPKLYKPGTQEQATSNYANDLLLRMAVAAFSFGSLMAFTVSLYAGYFQGMDMVMKRFFHFISWALATPVYLYSGLPFFRGAFHGLKNKSLNMDTLLVSGISLAYFYSVYVTLTDRGEVYFDSVCMIYFFILLGKYLEALSRNAANRKINNLLSKLPEICTIITDTEEKKVLSSQVKQNDIVQISAGDRIPIDGILLNEDAYIDESFLTGESKPIHRKFNEKVFAGSLSINSVIRVKAISSSGDSTISVLQRLIEKAMSEKPTIQRKTDAMASTFIKVVLSVAVSSFLGWIFYSGSLEKSLINAISVLIVACPCALGLAIPSTLVINNLINSRKGIILKNPDIIEALSKVNAIIFDKTGTLTEGRLKVVGDTVPGDNITLQLISILEKNSTHPIAKAILEYIQTKNLQPIEFSVKKIEELAGQGIEGDLAGNGKDYNIKIGNLAFIKKSISIPSDIQLEFEETSVFIAVNNKYAGYILLSDTLRKSAKSEIQSLKKITNDIYLLSGDQSRPVETIAKELEIINYQSEMKPQGKLKFMEDLQQKGKIVVMVGDGINDAGVLAKSNIGISLELASDISIDKSDVILFDNDLKGVRLSIFYSKQTARTIRQNIVISLLYNSIMLPLAAFGFMLPVYCAFFMTLSSLTVIANSFLLKIRAGKYS